MTPDTLPGTFPHEALRTEYGIITTHGVTECPTCCRVFGALQRETPCLTVAGSR